ITTSKQMSSATSELALRAPWTGAKCALEHALVESFLSGLIVNLVDFLGRSPQDRPDIFQRRLYATVATEAGLAEEPLEQLQEDSSAGVFLQVVPVRRRQVHGGAANVGDIDQAQVLHQARMQSPSQVAHMPGGGVETAQDGKVLSHPIRELEILHEAVAFQVFVEAILPGQGRTEAHDTAVHAADGFQGPLFQGLGDAVHWPQKDR